MNSLVGSHRNDEYRDPQTKMSNRINYRKSVSTMINRLEDAVPKRECEDNVRFALIFKELDIKLSEFDAIVDEIHYHCNHVGLPEILTLSRFCTEIIDCWCLVNTESEKILIPSDKKVECAFGIWKRENWGGKYPINDSSAKDVDQLGSGERHPFDFQQFNEGVKNTFSKNVPSATQEKLEEVSKLLYDFHFKEYGVPNSVGFEQCMENLAYSFFFVYSKRTESGELSALTIDHWFTCHLGENYFHFNHPGVI